MPGTTTPVEPRLNFVTLVVADLDRARRFYLNGLGWTAALDVGGEVVMVHVGEKLVLSLCYDQELNLREIGAVLEVTESRVCQIRSQAITRLRNQLRGML